MTNDFTVLYDASVLYPAPLRSFLMYLAMAGLYRANGRPRSTTSGRGAYGVIVPISPRKSSPKCDDSWMSTYSIASLRTTRN